VNLCSIKVPTHNPWAKFRGRNQLAKYLQLLNNAKYLTNQELKPTTIIQKLKGGIDNKLPARVG